MKSEIGRDAIKDELLSAGLVLPYMCTDMLAMVDSPTLVYEKTFTDTEFKVRKFEDFARLLSGACMSNLTLMRGERMYYLTVCLAELTVDQLMMTGFSLLSVLDLLHPSMISACGMIVEGEWSWSHVYQLDPGYGQVAMSETAEMVLGGYLAGKTLTR